MTKRIASPDGSHFASETLNELLARSSERKKIELKRLFEVLCILEREGDSLTTASVGRRLQREGGIKTQSLRNDPDYLRLIKSFQEGVDSKKPRRKRSVTSELDFTSIPDIQVRAFVEHLMVQNKVLQNQNNELKSAFKAIRSSEFKEKRESQAASQRPKKEGTELSPHQLETLRRALDPDRFLENGWTIKEDGSLSDELGVSIFPPGFMQAVAALREN
jgi:hypothetical protein